jgi:hypothetical protein
MIIRVFSIIVLLPLQLLSQGIIPMKFSNQDFPANPKIKENYRLVFNSEFEESWLNTQNWIPYYLPQWSSRERSKPNYELKNGQLLLQITKNQQPWCPEFNGKVKCSSIQTGIFAGKLGTKIGQHSFFNPACVVREEQKKEHTFLPQYGYIEIRAKALATKSNVVSLWMIGYEDQPERSAELCVFEVKGWNVTSDKVTVGFGIHKFNDPTLQEEFYEEEFAFDATQFHIYAAKWTQNRVDFFIDNQLIKTINQSPNYPMQLMLGIYEVPVNQRDEGDFQYPKSFVIDYVRGYEITE